MSSVRINGHLLTDNFVSFRLLSVVVTVLGNDGHLLVKPKINAIQVHHINDRFTTNARDVTYTVEAYA